MSQNVQDEVFDIIAAQAKVDRATLTPQTTLKDLGVTSLDAIEVIFDIEERFDVTLPDREANFDADTVGGLIDAVNEALAAKEQPAG
ncbi:MAG TPA: acyl carrier protein [Luteibacter sp.]|nr:acyl carrier protein [Luteibacter sp.]